MLNRTHTHLAALILFWLAAPGAASPTVTRSGTSPDYLVHAWKTENGLPQNWVSSLAQTPDGYLWIGTRYGGLARFDGVRFVAFNPQNTLELQDVQVEHLSVDETGRLWVIMGNESITALDHGQFELFRWPRSEPRLRADHVLSVRSNQVLFAGEFPYLPELNLPAGTNGWKVFSPPTGVSPDVGSFSLDRDDNVWMVTQRHRLARFTDGRYQVMSNAPGLPGTSVAALATDAARQLWLATPSHLFIWDGRRLVDRTPTNAPPPDGILQIAFSGDGGLWVLEKDRLRKFRNGEWVTEANPKEFQPDTSPGTFSLYGDAQGSAWLISNGHGLWHVKADGSSTLLTEKTGLPSVFITCWFQDAEGDVWIGTAGGGIARIRESLFHALGPAEGLPGKVVRSVCVDEHGELWAGTMSGGLAHWQDGRFSAVPLPAQDANPNESVTVFPDGEDGLWVGTLNHGLLRLHDGKFTRPPTPWGTVRVLFGDRQRRLWVGGLVNLFCLSNGQFTLFGSADGFVDSHAIGAMAEDAAGTIWIGTGPGDLWKLQKGQFTRCTPPREWPSVRFAAVLPDTNGVVWVGTLGGGLLRFQDGEFSRCTKSNGLPDDYVSQLLDSGDGHLWAGTYAGIFRASKTDLEAVASGRAERVPCRVYGRFDGLPALECSSGFQPACWRAQDGRLCFSTANGVVTVNPLEITPNRVPPIVLIEEMLVDGKPRQLPETMNRASDSNASADKLQIAPGQHYVQFRFTGLNFAAPDGVRFRVRLEGVDGPWQDTGGQRQIGYGPLPPGDYHFHVLACNNDGVWNEEGASLAFTVLPYFWETWTFKIALGALALTALALAQRRRYRRKLDQVERQRAMERERTRIAQDLHDELGTSLTQISMLSALANRAQTQPPESRELIEHVRGRARDMVTALDEIVWAVNPRNDSLVELISYLGHFAEEFLQPAGIRCRLDIPSHLPAHPVPAELRHHLFLAFKEAVNNVARHSGATEVSLRVKTSGEDLQISIEDNGSGIKPPPNSEARVGNGLSNMRQRMEQLGGRAHLESTPGQGTVISFHLPLD